MKRRGLKLNRGHRWSLYAVGLVLLFTGLAWMGMHRLAEADDLRESWRGLKPAIMSVHGLAATAFVLLLGTLLPIHVRHAWHARRNRANGAFFLTAVSTLTITGYLLYYLGSESLRALCSNLHFWLGTAIPILLLWHIWSGRRASRTNS